MTVPTPTVTTGGTVIVTTAVPHVVGQRLDVAKERLHRAGFDPDVDGGGLFGILRDSSWDVVAQDPLLREDSPLDLVARHGCEH